MTAATQPAVFYATDSKILRRKVIPDDDAQLAALSPQPGESMMLLALAEPYDDASCRAAIAAATAATAPLGRCCVIDDGGYVIGVCNADPALDTHPQSQLVASDHAGPGLFHHRMAKHAVGMGKSPVMASLFDDTRAKLATTYQQMVDRAAGQLATADEISQPVWDSLMRLHSLLASEYTETEYTETAALTFHADMPASEASRLRQMHKTNPKLAVGIAKMATAHAKAKRKFVRAIKGLTKRAEGSPAHDKASKAHSEAQRVLHQTRRLFDW